MHILSRLCVNYAQGILICAIKSDGRGVGAAAGDMRLSIPVLQFACLWPLTRWVVIRLVVSNKQIVHTGCLSVPKAKRHWSRSAASSRSDAYLPAMSRMASRRSEKRRDSAMLAVCRRMWDIVGKGLYATG